MGDGGPESGRQAWFVGEWADHSYAGLFAKDLNRRSLLNAREGRSDGIGAIQGERDHPDLLPSKGFDGQQGMIDSAQSGSSNHDNRKAQPFDHAHHVVALCDGDLHAADSFDHHAIIPAGQEAVDFLDGVQIDGLPFGLSSSKWSDRQFKRIGTDSSQGFFTFYDGSQSRCIRPSGSSCRDSCLDRFHHTDREAAFF